MGQYDIIGLLLSFPEPCDRHFCPSISLVWRLSLAPFYFQKPSTTVMSSFARANHSKSFEPIMPPYDSDSSGDEDNDYTLTNVLLGYASTEAKDDEISQLGGRPVC